MKSFLSGGRNSNNSASDLIKKIEESNNHNKGFIVPFNTGLNYDKLPLDNIHEELKVLEALSKHEKMQL